MSELDDFLNGGGDTYNQATDNPLGKVWQNNPIGATTGGLATLASGGNPLKNTPFDMAANSKYLGNRDPTVSKGPEDTSNALDYLGKETSAYDGITKPTLGPVNLSGPSAAADAAASNVGPSSMNGISTNPENTKAQMAQMAALQSLAANGGRDAASDANLASIRAGENQNARGQQEAIMQNAQARGMGGSGSSLLAQLTGSQGAVDRQSAEDMNVAGMQANKALSAGQGAASIGSNMEGQQFGEKAAVAQANDAAAKFNAANSTGVSEFNTQKNQGVNNAAAAASNQGQVMNNYQIPEQDYQNTMGIAGAKAGVAKSGVDYYGNKYKEDVGAQGNTVGGLLQFGGAVAGAGAKAMGAAAAHGGRIPGTPAVHGDSSLNDFVPVQTSPGEVVVPRSLAMGGNKQDIGNFVQHAPRINAPGQPGGRDKEAMLSALKHLSMHGRA